MNTAELQDAIRNHLDDLTKPKGSLGKLEEYAERLALIQKRVPPRIEKKAVFVIAGDHGIVEEGVSLYPKAVTAQMVHNFMAGGAGINVLAKSCGFDVFAVDAGVDADFPHSWTDTAENDHQEGGQVPDIKDTNTSRGKPRFFSMKACRGSANFARAAALSPEAFSTCIRNGKVLADFAVQHDYDMVALGDMGIGNTSSAAALCIAFGLAPEAVIDRGTGIDDAMLEHKYRVITDAVAKHCPSGSALSPEAIGACFAGPELATAAGLILGLSGSGTVCMLDGFPISAAALLTSRMNPAVTEYCLAGHESRVKGHRVILEALGLEPIVQLEMRLGEGTGAVIGGFVASLGAKIACEMATFSGMHITQAEKEELDY